MMSAPASSASTTNCEIDVPVERGEVVVLDENAGRQVGPMILATAREHGVLLERPPPRQRFSRVEDACLRPLYGLDVARGEGRNTG
jgi:hypothetical protein